MPHINHMTTSDAFKPLVCKVRLQVYPHLCCCRFVFPRNHLVLCEHFALPHLCSCCHCFLLLACCNALVCQRHLESVKLREVCCYACCWIPRCIVTHCLVFVLLPVVILMAVFSWRCLIICRIVESPNPMYSFLSGASASLPTTCSTRSFPAALLPK